MAFWNRNGGGGTAVAGTEGVAIRVRSHNRPRVRRSGRVVPWLLVLSILAAAAFYVVAHYSVATGVWPVHGTSPRAGQTLLRDAAALAGWLGLLLLFRSLGYRGNWGVIVLPVVIFCISRPVQFSIFTDPVYQAKGVDRREANELKAARSAISTVERAYSEERERRVYGTETPDLPDPWKLATQGATTTRGGSNNPVLRLLGLWSVFLAPLAMLAGFLWGRNRSAVRWIRDRRIVPFALTMIAFGGLAFVSQLGKVFGTTPWELFLPVFVLVWAATLADDVYNLARPEEALQPRRIAKLLLYGALPLVPFLVLHELGLSIVLAGSLATMLLVGTRRGWWAGLMLVAWTGLVFAAFTRDERSQTRFQLAYNPYRDLSGMTDEQAQRWGAKVHQIKLFDANVLAGGLLGEGPGRGHPETAPNSADDGYITAVAAQYGLAGTLSLVLLYVWFVLEMLGVASQERSAFGRSLVTGLAMLLAIPFWLATLGGLRVIPLTGVAAAFAAHGGSKLLASAVAVGIVAGISHRRKLDDQLEQADAMPGGGSALDGVRVQ